MAQSGQKLPQTRISGQVIIDELIRNMDLGKLEMGYSILLPCLFSVYLHPDDFARLAGVQDLVKEDAKRALGALMAEWNANKSVFRRGAARKQFASRRTIGGSSFSRYRRRRTAGRRRDPLRAERRGAARLPRRQDYSD